MLWFKQFFAFFLKKKPEDKKQQLLKSEKLESANVC